MADLWLPGAQRWPLADTAATDGGPAKAIAHITWDKNATKAKPQALVSFENLRSYFSGGGASVAPHILWDPFTGRFAQYYPANSRSKSVADVAGGTRTNRAGKVVIQIEALFFPWCVVAGKAYEHLTDTPCKGWAELSAWVKSQGVPDAWPMGIPTTFDSHRSESVWESHAGWYGHSQVPENDHQDPGSWPAFIKEATPVTMTTNDANALLNVKLDNPATADNEQVTLRGLLWQTGKDVADLKVQVAALTAALNKKA